jgi:membrane-associated protease RseP (regulator of RpoE activity)
VYEEILAIIAALILFWVAVWLLNRKFDLKKRGFSVSPGMIMWRTKRGLRIIDRLSRPKRFWRTYGSIAVVFGVVMMVFMAINLALNLIMLLESPVTAGAGVQFILPGLVPGLTPIAWIIGIATVLVVHELSHGFLTRAQNMKIDSVGGMFFVAIPGAFVEPNEKQLNTVSTLKRLRIYAVGAFSNVLFAVLILALILILLVPKPGVYVDGLAVDSPADNHNIGFGMRLYSINGIEMNTPTDFERFMNTSLPGENIRVMTSAGENTITLAQSPYYENRGFFGVHLVSTISRWNFANPLYALGAAMAQLLGTNIFHPYIFDALVPWAVIDILKWIFALNVGIGLFNLVPMVPLDGGYILRGIFEKIVSKERAVIISKIVAYLILGLLVANIALGWLW